jgi:hypothetical protein
MSPKKTWVLFRVRSAPEFEWVAHLLCSKNRLLRNRAVFHAGPATGAKIHFDAAGAFADLDLEIAGFSLNRFQICICD